MVTNIIFTVLWRGKTGRTRKEALASLYNNQGLAIASINLLALNNKLYTRLVYVSEWSMLPIHLFRLNQFSSNSLSLNLCPSD